MTFLLNSIEKLFASNLVQGWNWSKIWKIGWKYSKNVCLTSKFGFKSFAFLLSRIPIWTFMSSNLAFNHTSSTNFNVFAMNNTANKILFTYTPSNSSIIFKEFHLQTKEIEATKAFNGWNECSMRVQNYLYQLAPLF